MTTKAVTGSVFPLTKSEHLRHMAIKADLVARKKARDDAHAARLAEYAATPLAPGERDFVAELMALWTGGAP